LRLVAARGDRLDAPLLVEVLEAGVDELGAFVRADAARSSMARENVAELAVETSLALLVLSGMAMTHLEKRSRHVNT
jgi:hypothetical protein